MGNEPVIVSDPEIPQGAPYFRGTRVLHGLAIGSVEANDTQERFLSRSPAAIHEAAIAPPAITGPGGLESTAQAALPNRQLDQDLIWLDGLNSGRTTRYAP